MATDVSFVITDPTQPDNPIVWVNPAFCVTTGYRLEEVLGRNPRFLQGPETAQGPARVLSRAVRTRTNDTATVLNYRKDGSTFWNQVSIAPVFDADGRLVNYVGVQVDVTAQILDAQARLESIAIERKARAGLALLSDLSDILGDLDDPLVLRRTQDLVSGAIRGVCLFLNEGPHGLRILSRLDESSVRRRVEADTLRRRLDPLIDLLDGVSTTPVELPSDLPQGGFDLRLPSGQVLAAIHAEAGGPFAGPVVVVPVSGRRRSIALAAFAVSDSYRPEPEPELDGDWFDGESDWFGGASDAAAAADGTGGTESSVLANHTISPTDWPLLRLIARRVGMAMDNAHLYSREHLLAEALQRSLLPQQALIPGLDVWTYYAPNSEHAQVGGDWYDVFELANSAVGIVIGDVVGHDVEAAAAMGQLRSVVRAYAFEAAAPGEVVMRVDQLVGGMHIPRSASLVYATLSPTDGQWTIRLSCAGHLPPLLVRGRSVTCLDSANGPLVGIEAQERLTGAAPLLPGDVLVFYTDGLIERRDRPLRAGLGLLMDVCSVFEANDAAGMGDELLETLADSPEDDIAMVIVRVPDSAPAASVSRTARQRHWQLPDEASSISRARRAVQRACATWGIPGAADAELVVSELVANAVLHGWGRVGLRLVDVGGQLRIEVEDANPNPPVLIEGGANLGHATRVGGYGMHIVDRLADWGWQPSSDGKVVWARMHQR